MKRLFTLLVLLLLVCSSPAQEHKFVAEPEITAEEILEHIKYLASDELRGREAGKDGCYKAGDYFMEELKSYGIEPAFDSSYFQEFELPVSIELTENNHFKIKTAAGLKELKTEKEFLPAPISGDAAYNGELVFAGYGISAPDLGYDDYDGIDVKGKMVVVFNGQPEYHKFNSKFRKFEDMKTKAVNARDKGAAGIIFVNGKYPLGADKFVNLSDDLGDVLDGFIAVQIKRSVFKDILKGMDLNPGTIQKHILENLEPGSFEIQNLTIDIQTEINRDEIYARNVAGILRGSDEKLKENYIVIGGHIDHLGMGIMGSLYEGDEPIVHNGADDNASGTVGVLELAEKLASERESLKRSYIFVAFSGEEIGLLGSMYFSRHLPVNGEHVEAMLNFDMIGRMAAERHLHISGTGTSDSWEDILTEENDYNFAISFDPSGIGGSDHTAFYFIEVPALFFFTGLHDDYHRPADDYELINSDNASEVLKYGYDVIKHIDAMETEVEFSSSPRARNLSLPSHFVTYGITPDAYYREGGVYVLSVKPNSSADKKGMKKGDIITAIEDENIVSLQDFLEVYSSFGTDKEVEFTIIRDGKEMKMKLKAESI